MRLKNAVMLALTAFIWGTAFVAQSVGMDYLEPVTFNGVRSLMGGVALLPCALLLGRRKAGGGKELVKGGLACGALLFAASTLQQTGIQYTTAGKAGSITAFYIVIVPVLGFFLHKKIGWKVWAAVAAALAGLYFLCITEGFSVSKGDAYVFACAVIFSAHILVVDYFAPKVDCVKMSCIQFCVCGIISLPPMFLFETPELAGMCKGPGPLLYAGVLSCGVAYTLQIAGQKNVNPAIASLILSLESCFSVLAGQVVLGEQMSAREAAGCVLMSAAVVLAQMPQKDKKQREM